MKQNQEEMKEKNKGWHVVANSGWWQVTGIRGDKELRAESAQERGMEEKERKFAGTAELSDLVCYQQELTEARAERLLEHIYPQKHAHTQNTQFL